MKLRITANGHPHELVVDKVSGEYKVTVEGQIYKCIFKENGLYINGELFPIEVEGKLDEGATITSSGRSMQVKVEQVRELEHVEMEVEDHLSKGGAGAILAPMPGKVISIKVKAGDAVKVNQVVVILEAMKMENEILSEAAGKVKDVKVKPGEAVEGGQVLVVVE